MEKLQPITFSCNFSFGENRFSKTVSFIFYHLKIYSIITTNGRISQNIAEKSIK